MAGTKEGGMRAKQYLIEKHGPDYYRNIGKIGGSAKYTKPKGFAYMKANGQRDKIVAAGSLGGSRSRRKDHEA